MFEVIKSFVGKYAIYALLALCSVLAIGLGVFYHLNAQKAAEVASLTLKAESLQRELDNEREWNSKKDAIQTQRDAEGDSYQREADKSRENLSNQYEKHRDWADSSVPDDVANGLREHLKRR